MATTVWLSVGYNFGCRIANDTLVDSAGGFAGSSYPMNLKTADFEVLRNIAMATIFWLSIYGMHIGATWRIRLNRPCAAAMRPCRQLFWIFIQ